MKTKSTGKRQLTHTPYLDGWRITLDLAVSERGAKAELARFLESQGRRTFQACQNLVSQVLAAKIVPNAEDLLAMDAWIRSQAKKRRKPTTTTHGR